MDERTNGGWNVWCTEKQLENEKKKEIGKMDPLLTSSLTA